MSDAVMENTGRLLCSLMIMTQMEPQEMGKVKQSFEMLIHYTQLLSNC